MIKKYLSIILSFIILLISSNKVKAEYEIFSDDFSNDSSDKWEVYSSPQNINWSVQNGRYGTTINIGGWVTNSVPRDEFWNDSVPYYLYELDCKWTNGDDKNIIFKYLNEDNFYEIHYNGNLIYLEQELNSGETSKPVGADYYLTTDYKLYNNIIYHFKFYVENNHLLITVYDGVNEAILFDVINFNPDYLGGKVGLRFGTGANPNASGWFDNIKVTALPEETPKEVLVIPGLGASWNTSAIMNCDLDDSTTWDLAPYAESVYNPIISALSDNGYEPTLFTYDWRKNATDTSTLLTPYINDLVEGNKINIIAHSFGGLVSKAYLDNEQYNNQFNKLITIGTPFKGSLLAYPVWSAGKIYQSNLLEKIAMTLLIKHCQEKGEPDQETVQRIAPSLQDLLPTEDYLFSKADRNYTPINKMDAKNSWLLNSPFNNISGITFATLSGIGFDTLETFYTKDANKNQQNNMQWIDGFPTKKVYTQDGDGTVLLTSSQSYLTENNYEIHQDHSGLISSNEGIDQILEFLNPSITFSSFSSMASTSQNINNSNSAIVFVSYPEHFSVTDNYGNVYEDEEGLVSILNPEAGNYTLNLHQANNKTNLIVSQFLPDEKVIYKEYKNYKNTGPSTLIYDPDNPQEDLVI